MIQAAMYFVLGLLAAGLIALILLPAIWQRAVRLTRARIEARIPVSRSEIEADKDQLRATFAVANRRLEMEAGRLKDRLANEIVEVGKRREEIATLTRTKSALTETIAGLEQRIEDLNTTAAQNEERIATSEAELADRDRRLEETTAALEEARASYEASALMTEEQRLELVARDTELGNITDKLADVTAKEAAVTEARDKLAAELEDTRARLAEEEKTRVGLGASLDVLNTERASRMAELERRASELQTLEGEIAAERVRRTTLEAELDALKTERADRIADHERRANDVRKLETEVASARTERDATAAELATLRTAHDEGTSASAAEIAALRRELAGETAKHNELQSRLTASETALATARNEMDALLHRHQAEVVEAGDNMQKAMAAADAERNALAAQLAALEDDFAALRAENTELRRVAGAEWESEREENRRLRERLAEIAVGVARLNQDAGEAAPAGGGEESATAPTPLPTAPHPAGPEGDNALADRLRALQRAGTRH